MPLISRFILLLGVLLISACAQQAPAFAPPSERPLAASEKPWPKNHVLGIAYHDVEDRDPDQAVVAVRTERMIEQLAWLRENGYKPVTVDQIMAARKGGPELPAKAILLSFDDGYSSFYTRVLPVLRAYNWHALLAPVGSWIDTPLNQPVDFAGAPRVRSDFLTWIRCVKSRNLDWWKLPRTPMPTTKGFWPTRRATCSLPPRPADTIQ
jgi:biofilm PGA synthesis lipoprotein PgaB